MADDQADSRGDAPAQERWEWKSEELRGHEAVCEFLTQHGLAPSDVAITATTEFGRLFDVFYRVRLP